MDRQTDGQRAETGSEAELTADEKVGGSAGEEHWAASQRTHQPSDTTEEDQDQTEGQQHHHGPVHVYTENTQFRQSMQYYHILPRFYQRESYT